MRENAPNTKSRQARDSHLIKCNFTNTYHVICTRFGDLRPVFNQKPTKLTQVCLKSNVRFYS